MARRVVCTNSSCGREYHLKDELAGRKVKCPGCGTILSVPQGTAAENMLEAIPQSETLEPRAPFPTGEAPQASPEMAIPQKTHAFAVASLVIGILGLLTSCLVIGGLLGIIGIILGIVGILKISNSPQLFQGKGHAAGGIAMGALAVAIAITALFLGWGVFKFGEKVFQNPEFKPSIDMNRIQAGLQQHRATNGTLPKSLDELPGETFANVPMLGEVMLADYEYLGGKLTEEELKESRRLLIYTIGPLESGERFILLVDGSILVLSDEEFQAALTGEAVPSNAGRFPMPVSPDSFPLDETD